MYLDLLLTFAKLGAMTFGGGYAMLPILQREVVENKKWVTEEEVLDYYAIGQCTPGVIAVNTASFVGYKLKGVPGAILATAGVILPSVLIITILAGVITQVSHLSWVQHAFAGIRVSVCALVTATILRISVQSVKDWLTAGAAIGAFILIAFAKLSPIIVVAMAVILGLLFGKSGEKR